MAAASWAESVAVLLRAFLLFIFDGSSTIIELGNMLILHVQ